MAQYVMTQDNFSSLVEQYDIVLIYFKTKWCPPCKVFSTIYNKVAERYPSIAFATVDAEIQVNLVQSFMVESVPSLLILKSGKIVFAESGALSAARLTNLIEQAYQLTFPTK